MIVKIFRKISTFQVEIVRALSQNYYIFLKYLFEDHLIPVN